MILDSMGDKTENPETSQTNWKGRRTGESRDDERIDQGRGGKDRERGVLSGFSRKQNQ